MGDSVIVYLLHIIFFMALANFCHSFTSMPWKQKLCARAGGSGSPCFGDAQSFSHARKMGYHKSISLRARKVDNNVLSMSRERYKSKLAESIKKYMRDQHIKPLPLQNFEPISDTFISDIDKVPDIETVRVSIKNTQRNVPLYLNVIKVQTLEIQRILGVENFELDILFCSDNRIRELNKEWLGKDKPTDILSFPICEFSSPGVFLDDSTFNHHLHLGDLVIAPRHIRKLIEQEKTDRENGIIYEDDETDAGVSKAMSTVFTLEERLPLLIIHGMLHLLGYDHETEKDWRVMTEKEEEVIQLLRAKNVI